MAAEPDPELTASVRETAPFVGLLGVEFVAAAPDEVSARLAWDATRCTAAGILHGGALMGLADSTGALLAFLNLPEGASGTATIESKTNFFLPVRGGHIHAVSRPLHRGKTTIVVETDLFDDEGRRVARVTQTQAVFG